MEVHTSGIGLTKIVKENKCDTDPWRIPHVIFFFICVLWCKVTYGHKKGSVLQEDFKPVRYSTKNAMQNVALRSNITSPVVPARFAFIQMSLNNLTSSGLRLVVRAVAWYRQYFVYALFNSSVIQQIFKTAHDSFEDIFGRKTLR